MILKDLSASVFFDQDFASPSFSSIKPNCLLTFCLPHASEVRFYPDY